MNDIKKFLTDLSIELKTQETDIQANPRFWVVAQYEWQACWEEQCQTYHYCDNAGESSTESFEEFMNQLKEEQTFDKEGTYLCEVKDWEDREDFNIKVITNWEDLPQYIKEEYIQIPMKKVHVIKKDTLFLTKRECQEHIDRNNYHYNSTVHTYAMTAWRSPQVEKLLDVLTNNDIINHITQLESSDKSKEESSINYYNKMKALEKEKIDLEYTADNNYKASLLYKSKLDKIKEIGIKLNSVMFTSKEARALKYEEEVKSILK